MLHESLKKLLGEDLANKVEEAVKGKGKEGKDLDIVIGNDGSYVPSDKFDSVKQQQTSAESALKAAADALKAIGGSGDPAKIADDVKAAQTTINDLTVNHKTEIQKIQKTTALKLGLGSSVHDPDDIIREIDLGKIDVDDMGSLKTNLDDLVKPIKEKKPYLFKEQQQQTDPNQPDIKGIKPGEPGTPPQPAAPSGPVIL